MWDKTFFSWQKREGIYKYRIFVDPSDKVVGAGDVEGERSVIAGLKTGNTYAVSVAAIQDQREGAAATSKFTTALPPPAKVYYYSKFIFLYKIHIIDFK